MIQFFRISFFCVVMSLVSWHAAFGQNGKALTLEECIELALKHNSTFKTAVYQVDRSGADVTAAYSAILPRVGASLSSSRARIGQTVNLQNIPVVDPATGQPIVDPETGQPVVDRVQSTSPGRTFDNHSISVSYNQTLWDFGRSFNAIKQAKASFEAASHSLTASRQNVISTVYQRYLELLKATKLQQEYELAVKRSKEQLSRTQSMYEIGSIAQIDVFRQEVTLGNDEINLINQQNVVDVARGNLNVAMGRDPETPITIAEVALEVDPPRLSLSEAIGIAEANNPDLRRFEYEMQSAEFGRKAAKSKFMPSIGINAVYSRDNDQFSRVYGEFDKNFFVRIGATLDFNIFNGLADKAAVSRQSATYSIARENHLNRRRTLQLEVKQAYLNLKAAYKITAINERNLRAAEEDFRLAQERYRVGAGTSLEVTEAQVSLTRARVNLVRTKYDALIAQAKLQAAMGTIAQQ